MRLIQGRRPLPSINSLQMEDEHQKLQRIRYASTIQYSSRARNNRPICQVILSSKNVDINTKRRNSVNGSRVWTAHFSSFYDFKSYSKASSQTINTSNSPEENNLSDSIVPDKKSLDPSFQENNSIVTLVTIPIPYGWKAAIKIKKTITSAMNCNFP